MPRIARWLVSFVCLFVASAGGAEPPPAVAADPPRIALLTTRYRASSHADAIGTKVIAGFPFPDGRVVEPRVQVVSIWIDQVETGDVGPQVAAAHGIPVVDSIEAALTLGTGELAVDGVLFIGEHGDYPRNRFGSKMYPRLRILDPVFRVFEASGRSVPMFVDKMLSHNGHDGRWVVDRAADLGAPLMAGSSLPMAQRVPELEHPVGTAIEEAVAVGYGPVDGYGFHVLEILQCMLERRAGGETGVASVHCVRGPAVWALADAGGFSLALAEAATEGMPTKRPGAMRKNAKRAVAIVVEYRDGTRGTALLITRHIGEAWGYAARLAGGEVVRTEFRLDKEKGRWSHFSYLGRNIEDMFLDGRPRTPVRRTLLTSGVLDAALRSLTAGGVRRPTPELGVVYRPLDVTVRRP